MIINELLENDNMSRYRLSKESGVPMTTITDICSGKADLEKCAAGTLHKIASVLGVTVDAILENNKVDKSEYHCSFETFKSNTCHQVKDLGDLDFIVKTLESDKVRLLFEHHRYKESMYLLGMLDYISRLNGVAMCTNYNDIRNKKLDRPCFPAGVIIEYAATGDESIKENAIKNAIPEFMRFNIVEDEIRDVC